MPTMNKWRCTATDAKGKTRVLSLRGPVAENDVRRLAQQILDAMKAKAIRSGAPDPGLKIVSLEHAGEDDGSVDQTARPLNRIDLEEYSLKNPDGTAKNSAAEALAKLD